MPYWQQPEKFPPWNCRRGIPSRQQNTRLAILHKISSTPTGKVAVELWTSIETSYCEIPYHQIRDFLNKLTMWATTHSANETDLGKKTKKKIGIKTVNPCSRLWRGNNEDNNVIHITLHKTHLKWKLPNYLTLTKTKSTIRKKIKKKYRTGTIEVPHENELKNKLKKMTWPILYLSFRNWVIRTLSPLPCRVKHWKFYRAKKSNGLLEWGGRERRKERTTPTKHTLQHALMGVRCTTFFLHGWAEWEGRSKK